VVLNRRAFLGGTGALLFAALPAAESRAAGDGSRIGFLFYGAPGRSPEIDAFRQGLRDLGYVEGQNITTEYRFADGRLGRLPELAAELVRLKVDVIVTPGTPASMAAKKATSTIPIVFAGVADALGAGLVASVARPGGNATGLTSISAALSGKRLELLKLVAPKATRVAVLYNPADQSNVLVLTQLQESSRALGLTLLPLAVRGPGEFAGAFASMAREHAQALFVAAGALTTEHRKSLVGLADKSRIPAMWGERQFVEAGGLMSYAVNFYDEIRRAATYVDKILKGAKPADLPVEQPTMFELIINLKTAKALGLSIPSSLLSRADQIIE
jgi:putative tryptophan/tyrosine transport system substrate-binding protein